MTAEQNSILKIAYGMLQRETPLAPANCGKLCGGACCKGTENEGMLLFPHEEEFLQKTDFFFCRTEGNYGYSALVCKGCCNRHTRPLACRFFPLFPLVGEKNGKEHITVILDPRAGICPLVRESRRLSPSFCRAVRRAGRVLLQDEETAAYLRKMSAELQEYITLRSALLK